MSQNCVPQTVPKTALADRHGAVPLTQMVAKAVVRRHCPRCDSDRVHRSHRRTSWERVLAFAILPYRCEFCALRFFRPRWVTNAR